MAVARDCMCVLEHAMPNLARYARDHAAIDAVTEFGGGYIVSPHSPDMSGRQIWVVTHGRGGKILARFKTEEEAKEEAKRWAKSRGHDHALDALMPNIMSVHARDASSEEIPNMNRSEIKEEMRKVSAQIDKLVNSGARVSLTDPLSVKLAQLRRAMSNAVPDHALDLMPNLKAVRDARARGNRV